MQKLAVAFVGALVVTGVIAALVGLWLVAPLWLLSTMHPWWAITSWVLALFLSVFLIAMMSDI